MQTIVQLTLAALQIGAVYILFSLGLTLIFGILRVVNFVHGHFFALAALLVSVVLPGLVGRGVPVQAAYAFAALAAIGATMLLAAAVYRFGLAHFQRDLEGAFIFTLGLALLLDGAFLAAFGGSVRSVPQIVEGTISILGASVSLQRLLLCLVAAGLTVALYWLLGRTRLGKALRAVAIDHEAAMLQGVPYDRIALAGFMLAALLAAVAGVLIAPVSVVSPAMGTDYLMKAFVAVVVGGLGSVPGAIVGALFIGLIEAVGGYVADSSTATIAVFVLVIAVLLFRPTGLLGRA